MVRYWFHHRGKKLLAVQAALSTVEVPFGRYLEPKHQKNWDHHKPSINSTSRSSEHNFYPSPTSMSLTKTNESVRCPVRQHMSSSAGILSTTEPTLRPSWPPSELIWSTHSGHSLVFQCASAPSYLTSLERLIGKCSMYSKPVQILQWDLNDYQRKVGS